MRYLSLFSGMEAAHLAWQPLGWECVGVAEIDPAACALLRHRLPHVPNLGSVVDITEEQIAALGHIDVVIGGSPCQDLSVAGRRAGLVGTRSSLFHHQVRIFDAAQSLCGARWLVWENVPGAFSSNEGRDFAVVAGTIAGCVLDVPQDGWESEGVALGDNGLVEWAVLDAQWFGLAQRRERVFAVLDTGNWTDRSPVLLERESLRGDSPPRRQAGQSVAGTLTNGARGRGGYSNDNIPLVSGTPQANGKAAGSVTQQDTEAGMLICVAYGGNNTSGPIEVGTALNACASASGRLDFESETFLVQAVAPALTGNPYGDHESREGLLVPDVAHTLRADGFDASEDGTGRGTPLIPVAFNWQGGGTQTTLGYDPGSGITGALHVGQVPAIAFSCKDSDPARSVSADLAPTLRAMGHADSHANAGGQVAVAFKAEVAPTLGAAGSGNQGSPALAQGMRVRRLTPIECERLQGAPDGWTLAPNAKGKPMADGQRYKMLGNSFAVPVIRWIGQQIQRAHAESKRLESAA